MGVGCAHTCRTLSEFLSYSLHEEEPYVEDSEAGC